MFEFYFLGLLRLLGSHQQVCMSKPADANGFAGGKVKILFKSPYCP